MKKIKRIISIVSDILYIVTFVFVIVALVIRIPMWGAKDLRSSLYWMMALWILATMSIIIDIVRRYLRERLLKMAINNKTLGERNLLPAEFRLSKLTDLFDFLIKEFPADAKTDEKLALQDAMYAAKKDIANEPIEIDYEKKEFTCPACLERIVFIDDINRTNKCLHCGQKLKE